MEFKWLNKSLIKQTEDRIEIMAPAKTDFFCGGSFSFHYSTDGINFYMMRYFHLPVGSVIKVGLLAQAPAGSGGIRVYENLSIEKKTVKNIRAGK